MTCVSVSKLARPKKTHTLDEVKKHNKKGDCWVVVKDKVYDVSKWVKFHPGGQAAILTLAGKDCTEVFKAFHSDTVFFKKLPAFYIGDLDEADSRPNSALSDDLEKLRQKFRDEGFFKTDYSFYGLQTLWLAFLLALTMFLVVKCSENRLAVVAAAFVMGIFWQQMAFIGHDLGHHGITYSSKTDDMIGVVCGNLLTGVSIGWWKASHNFHHIVTNSIEYDPDIQHMPFLAVSKEYFRSIFSFYHKKTLDFNSAAKFFVSKQHYLYYLIMALARFNLYIQSFLHVLFSKEDVRMFKVEIAALLGFWCWFLWLASYLPTGRDVMIFILVSHMVAGIIHVQITLSHFSMPTFKGLPHYQEGYIAWQFYTTMNVDCYPIFDWFHGGLQFQVEHHLFPHACRNRLRAMMPDVQALCKKHNLPYNSKTFLDANIDVIRVLRLTALEAKGFSSIISDGINAIG